MKTLFVAWKDVSRSEGGWFPVGRLDAEQGCRYFEFRYVQGALVAAKERGFAPFDSFPDFHGDYVSSKLFPFFANRVQNPNRPSFQEYLYRLDLEKGPFNPIDALAISEGHRATDNLEIFPKVQRIENGLFAIKFFLHGWRYLRLASTSRILDLEDGEHLNVAIDVTNKATIPAIQLQTQDRTVIGYAPRYLIDDLFRVISADPHSVKAEVSRVNLPPAPVNQRVLIKFQGRWPNDYQPMCGPLFQPLVKRLYIPPHLTVHAIGVLEAAQSS